MSDVTHKRREDDVAADLDTSRAAAPGKRSLTDARYGLRLKASGTPEVGGDAAHSVAEAALSGPSQALPYQADLEQQFGTSLDHIGAHTGAGPSSAGRSLGASGFTLGDQVGFADAAPSRATVAHEVAHALQQTRGGGAGSVDADEAEARAAETGGGLGYSFTGAGASAVRLQEAPQPQTPILDAAASRAAITFNSGRGLPADAWQKIGAVAGVGTSAIDDAMVQAIARWQQGQGLSADGKAGDTTVQWMSQAPGGAGLENLVRSNATVYLGINPTSRPVEQQTMRNTGADTSFAAGRRDQDTAVVGGSAVDLQTEEGLDAYVAQFDRVDAARRAAIRSFMEQGHGGARDELAQFVRFFYEAEIGQRLIKRVVLSGHSGGYSIVGEADNASSISFSHLQSLPTLFPRATGQVEDLMLSACNTGQTGKLQQYTAMFPNLRSIWAYVGYSPSGATAGAGANRHMKAWEGATRGAVDHDDLDAARERIGRGGDKNDKNVAIWTRDSNAATPQYETSSPEADLDFGTLRAAVDGEMGAYTAAYDNGSITLPALSSLYTKLQNLTGNHQAALGRDYDRYFRIMMHVLYLRHWPKITENFWLTHSAAVTAAYAGHGAVPNFKASRSAVLASIAAFPGDPSSEGYRLLNEVLKGLDPAQIPDHWF